MMKRRLNRVTCLAVLVLVVSALGASRFIQPDAVNFKTILTTAPSPDSDQSRREIESLLQMQANRTPAEIKRAQDEETITAFSFSDVLGTWFNPDDLPITASLMRQAEQDAKPISDAAKQYFGRTRPYLVDPRIKPCVTLESTKSFPSGHSTRATMWAMILSEMFPEHRDELMRRSQQIGDDRELAGMHFPSDVEAGRLLGAAIGKALLAKPAFQVELNHAKDECLADVKRK